MPSRSVALIGGRGYAGAELLGLIAGHPGLLLALASSGSRAGQPLVSECPAWPDPDTRFLSLEARDVGEHEADAWVLAVPNGAAQEWAKAIGERHPDTVIVDLSADHRFDAAWVYGLPERHRDALRNARRIANPGCYATGAQLALLPIAEALVEPPTVFAVSGFSGAGKAPSPRNDPGRLRDNLVPYRLAGHVHEREISAQLERPVRFMPHVAGWFRGISLTIAARLREPASPQSLLERFEGYYAGEPLVRVSDAIPEVRSVSGTPSALIGGFTVDERDTRCVTVVAVLDNLLKGAASQAVQNLNLALGMDEHEGLLPWPRRRDSETRACSH